MAETSQTAKTFSFAEGISVTRTADGSQLTLTINLSNPVDGVLHWGLSRRVGGAWSQPPEDYWPQGTTPADGNAVRTPFSGNEVTIHLNSSGLWRGLAFVVYAAKENRWIKNNGQDFVVPLPRGGRSPEEALAGIDRINADYARHARRAAEIAREYFDANRILAQLLEVVST